MVLNFKRSGLKARNAPTSAAREDLGIAVKLWNIEKLHGMRWQGDNYQHSAKQKREEHERAFFLTMFLTCPAFTTTLNHCPLWAALHFSPPLRDTRKKTKPDQAALSPAPVRMAFPPPRHKKTAPGAPGAVLEQ